jgi:hypothetical protein
MAIDILITIFITAIVQSIFGTGVLLFGTPILLIFGYNFQIALIILLPTSVLINFFQLKTGFGQIDFKFYKRLFLFSIPLIVLFLYVSNSISINIHLFIGVFLILLSLKENIVYIQNLIKLLIQYEPLYLIFMGMIHGLTNLGGALLSVIVFNNNLTKESKRATIAISYLTFAIFQIMTLTAVLYPNEILNKNYFIYWILGPGIFFIVEKYVFFRIDEKKYGYYSNYFLFAIGLVLLAKNLL